jgi:hypothetical protein
LASETKVMVTPMPDHHLDFRRNALWHFNLRSSAELGDGLARARTLWTPMSLNGTDESVVVGHVIHKS